MYSTVNVVGPAGSTVTPSGLPFLLGLLLLAATLTTAGMFALNGAPARAAPKGPSLPRAVRYYGGPGERRR
jgi:hypothetical protein